MIYLSKRTEQSWISFDYDPHLSNIKKRIFERCVPCLSNLLHSIRNNLEEIPLGHAYDCWKLCIIAPNLDQCMKLLMDLEELCEQESLCGKFGTGHRDLPTRVIVFYFDEGYEKLKKIEIKLRVLLKKTLPSFPLFIRKGCAFPFEVLFGPWQIWQPKMQVVNYSEINFVIKQLKALLYGEQQQPSLT